MANVLVAVSFFFGLLVYIGTNVNAVIGRALFCRDPDTGKLHPPNTTWPSTTFCGNYTCKIRKRNITDIRHLEASEIPLNETQNLDEDIKIQEHAPNTLDQLVAVPSPSNGDNTTTENRNHYDKDNKLAQIEKAIKNGDRYLTEDEIKALSNLLHTVKKSDLEAIIDIYNLAQDIYNEMNRSTIDDMLTDHVRVKGSSRNGEPDETRRKHSYWYEPLRNGMFKESTDSMSFIPTIATKVETHTKKYPAFPNIFTNQDFRQLPYYQAMPEYTNRLYNFYQQLHQKGQTQFQAQLTQLNQLPDRPFVPFQIKDAMPNYQDPFWVKKRASLQKLKLLQPSPLGNGPAHAYRGNVPNTPKLFYYGVEVQDTAVPLTTAAPGQQLSPVQGPLTVPGQMPIAMPPPVLQYSPGAPPGLKFAQGPDPGPQYAQGPGSGIQYAQVPAEPGSKYAKGQGQGTIPGPPKEDSMVSLQAAAQPVPTSRRRPYSIQKPLSKAVLENPYLHDDVRAFEQQQVVHPKRSNLIQQMIGKESINTKPISNQVVPTSIITEIRTNVIEPQKPIISQYRKLSLRKVGRLVNLKDLFRIKRQIDIKDMSTDEEYEAYVERKTCDLDMYPGFFRKGNESDVFPRCCPQRIKNR